MLQLHRVFCATPWEMEPEATRFHQVIAAFNEAHAQPRGVLYIPVALTNIRDKRPVQYVVEENVRECRHFILLVSEDWGPVERNFEEEYLLAKECSANPAMPMRETAVVRKIPRSGRPLASGMPEPVASFTSLQEFDAVVEGLLTQWLESLLHESQPQT